MASETARTHLLWAILSLVLQVTFGHASACRSPALTFSAAIHFPIKRSAPCSAVMRHSPSSWAAVVHWSALIPKALTSSRKPLIYFFFWLPTLPAPVTTSVFRLEDNKSRTGGPPTTETDSTFLREVITATVYSMRTRCGRITCLVTPLRCLRSFP